MTAPAGLSAQITLAQETTYGTYVAGTRALDMVSETLKATRVRMESKGLRAGRRLITSPAWVPGARTVAGTVKEEVSQINQAFIFLNALGGTVSTVNNADSSYTHTLTPGDMTGKSMSIQIGRPDVTGVVNPFSYTGCKFTKWTLACKAGEIAELDLDIVAQDETTAQSLVNASTFYPATMVPLSFVGGQLTIGGTQIPCHDVNLIGDNKLDANRLMLRAAPTVLEPLEGTALRDYTGTLTADFTGLSPLYTQFVNGTEAALVLTFQGANIAGAHYYGIVITANVRFDGDTPNVAGPMLLTHAVPFKAIASGAADSSAISVAVTTTEATP